MNDKLPDIGRGADPLEAARLADEQEFKRHSIAAELTAKALRGPGFLLRGRAAAETAVAAAVEPIVEEGEAEGGEEPVFVLRAQDMLAPGIVEEWARRAEDMHINGPKVRGAREIAARMREWPNRRMPN